MDAKDHKSYQKAEHKASSVLKDPKRLQNLAKSATQKARHQGKDFFGKIKDDFQTVIRLMKAYSEGRYKVIPWKSLTMIVAALIYFVVPLDFVPDFIFSIGFVDDLAVLGWTFERVKKDLAAFEEWEQGQGGEVNLD